MRWWILGMMIGCFALQQRPALPSPVEYPAWAAIGVALVLFVVGLIVRPPLRDLARGGKFRHSLTLALFLTSGVALGFGYAHWRAAERLAEALPREWEGVDIPIRGVVASLPTVTERGTRFLFEVEDVLVAGATVPRSLSLNWYAETDRASGETRPPPLLVPGDRWQFTVRLRRPHGTANPHGFDFEAWALERNIRATGYVRSKSPTVREPVPSNNLMADIDRARLAIRDRMQRALGDQPFSGVLIALVIGEQNAIPAEQWKVFWRTGTGHLMSISGLHITMVAAMLYWLVFRLWGRLPVIGRRLVLRVPAQRAAAVAGALGALCYSLLAGFSVPTQRTFFMLAAVAVALVLGRATSATRVLAFALFVVLLLDPWAVLSPGFWLSFGAVAMIFFAHAHRIARATALSEAISTQMVVTLGLLPLTLVLFQEVSIISPVANAFAIPLVSLLVVPLAIAGGALSLLMPTEWLLVASHQLLAGGYWALDQLARLPNAVWQSHAPAAWTVLLACLGALILTLPRGVPLRWSGALACLPMFLVLPPSPRPGELWVTLLDVGQGLSAVVRTATRTLVYDTGPAWNPDADSGNRIVVPYLRGEGIRDLTTLIVSHDDEDHYGGARSVIDARSPQWVMTSVPRERPYLANAKELMRCEVGDAWHWDGVDFEILHPHGSAYDEPRKTNNMGCVLKITAASGSILLTADIEKIAERELIERDKEALKSDVMVVPHHGSRTSSTDAFIDAVAPSLALIPVGYRSRFRHPNAAVVERYASRRIEVLRTDYEGAITVKFGASASTPSKPSVERYRRDSVGARRYWFDLPVAEPVTLPANAPVEP